MDSSAANREVCPPEATIVGFLEHRLSSERRAELEVHFDACASCRQLVVELSSEWEHPSTAGEAHTTLGARPIEGGERLAKGTVVGRFVVLDLLGAGGMGVVYMAYDPELDRKVALKLLHTRARAPGHTSPELLTEAQVTARITHANVIAIYDVGTYRGQVFAAMELVEGGTLRKWMAERPRTWREVVDVFVPAGEGLAAAHATGVVHRDFKPENVLLGRDGRIKVSDFGLATDSPPAAERVAGTPAYLPVEGFEPGRLDARGDQFSFCVAFYEALHGRRPFAASSYEDRVAEVRRGPTLEGPHRKVPAQLSHVVRRGLAFAPEDRYPSMRELLADVRRAPPVRRRRWLLAATAGAVAVAAGAAVVLAAREPLLRRPCADAGERLAGIWDDARRAAVRSAFLGTQVPFALAAFERVAAALDDYVTQWAAIYTEACEATEVRLSQAPAVLELRMVCLDRARIQLRALGDALITADARTVSDAATAAASLPALDACSDLLALRAIIAPPLTMTARAEVSSTTSAPADPPIPLAPADTASGPLDSIPDFQLPFGCGETWQLTNPGRRPAQVDFTLPGGAHADGLAVFASAPGWVTRIDPDHGEVVLGHGDGWFTVYRHMTEIGVARYQYIGRGHVIGSVGSVNVKHAGGGFGLARLRYAQLYRPGAADVSFDDDPHPAQPAPTFERVALRPSATGALTRTSANNCPAGGAPGGAAQYDVPNSTRVLSPTRLTFEIATRRSGDHALFERRYDRGWSSAPLPHTIVGQPAVAVYRGELHIVARKSDGTLFDYRYSPFTGWSTTYLEGAVSGDPDVAVHGWRRSLQVVARGADGTLYRWITTADGSWSRHIPINGVQIVGTPALVSHYDALYIAMRTPDGSLRIRRTDRREVPAEWRLPGAASDPDAVIDPRTGLVNIVARGPDDRLYRWRSDDPDFTSTRPEHPWSEPEVIDADHAIAGTPAVIAHRGALHLFARTPDHAIHHWWNDGAWHRKALGGSFTTSPDAAAFGGQIQTFGRGLGGTLSTIWFDPVSGLWTPENQGVPITE